MILRTIVAELTRKPRSAAERQAAEAVVNAPQVFRIPTVKQRQEATLEWYRALWLAEPLTLRVAPRRVTRKR
jgi:hypothetical protein